MKNDFLEELFFSAAFPLPFRALCLIGLGILGWATNLHGLHLFDIDAVGVLDLGGRLDGRRLTSPLPLSRAAKQFHHGGTAAHLPVYKLFVSYALWITAAWTAYRYATYANIALADDFKFIPAVAMLCVLTVLVCPWPVLYKAERDRFLYSVRRCLFPSRSRVLFADVVFADVLTSFAKVFGDMWLSVLMVMPGGSLLHQPTQEGMSRWILPTLMSLPYAIRLRQCLIDHTSPQNDSQRPLLNALKYASSFPVIYLSAAQRMVVVDGLGAKGAAVTEQGEAAGGHMLFRLWLVAAAVNSLYSFWWDVTNDWGLDLLVPRKSTGPSGNGVPPRPLLLPRLHSRTALLTTKSQSPPPEDEITDEMYEQQPQHISGNAATYEARRTSSYGLRATLLFPLAVYPVVIVVDLVLRLTWSAKLSSHLHSYSEGDLVIFWIELAEVVRRWMWTFVRVEWEAIKEGSVRESSRRSRSPAVAARKDMGGALGTIGEQHDDFEMIPSGEDAELHERLGK